MAEIAVVIPTRNNPGPLGRCLASLCEQDIDPSRYEICVVNNGARDLPAQVVRLVSAHYRDRQLAMIDEPALGVARARNTGMRHTRAPLVVQADDDVTAPADWLRGFIDAFARGGGKTGRVGGQAHPAWPAPRPEWLTDAMLALLAVSTPAQASVPCNNCYSRAALEQAGLFPLTLGYKGRNTLPGEHAVGHVIAYQGWQILDDAAVAVRHHLSAERLTPAWFRRRAFWQGVADHAAQIYLNGKGIAAPPRTLAVELPLARENWGFINDGDEPPTADRLDRLRDLGFVLAGSGFIPV